MAVKELQKYVVGCGLACGLSFFSAQAQFATPGDAPAPKEKTRGREPAQMSRAGLNDSFSYEASAQYPGSYVVRPLDGSSPLIVSDTFLSTLTRGGTVQQGEEVLGTLRSYPSMIQQTYDQLFSDTFPDRTVQTTALTPSYFALQDGRAVTVTQDPAAAPYARITIRNSDGSMAELSMAKEIVQSVLSGEQIHRSRSSKHYGSALSCCRRIYASNLPGCHRNSGVMPFRKCPMSRVRSSCA